MQLAIRKQKGFTLLELLIVIVIIGILIALVLPNLINGPIRARDVRRKEDLNAISSGLEQYYNDNQAYPAAMADLTAGSYLKEVPKDPRSNADYTYTALPATGPPYTSFTLTATLENKNDKDVKSGTTDTYEVVNKQ